jgi:hypothetical protein
MEVNRPLLLDEVGDDYPHLMINDSVEVLKQSNSQLSK